MALIYVRGTAEALKTVAVFSADNTHLEER